MRKQTQTIKELENNISQLMGKDWQDRAYSYFLSKKHLAESDVNKIVMDILYIVDRENSYIKESDFNTSQAVNYFIQILSDLYNLNSYCRDTLHNFTKLHEIFENNDFSDHLQNYVSMDTSAFETFEEPKQYLSMILNLIWNLKEHFNY